MSLRWLIHQNSAVSWCFSRGYTDHNKTRAFLLFTLTVMLFEGSGQAAEQKTIKHFDTPISLSVISPNGNYIVNSRINAPIELLNPRTGEVIRRLEVSGIKASASKPSDLAISSSGALIASPIFPTDPQKTPPGEVLHGISFSHGILGIWSANAGTLLHALPVGAGGVNGVAISRDEKFVVATPWALPHAIGWSLATGKKLFKIELPSPALAISIASAGKTLISTHRDGTFQLYDLREKRVLIRQKIGLTDLISTSANGHIVATGSTTHGVIGVWDGSTGKLLAKIQHHFKPLGDGPFGKSTGNLAVLWMSPNGKHVYSLDNDQGHGIVRVWDLASAPLTDGIANIAYELRGDAEHRITNMALTSDGQHLITSQDDGLIRISNAETGNSIASFQLPESRAWRLAAHAKNQLVVAATGAHRMDLCVRFLTSSR